MVTSFYSVLLSMGKTGPGQGWKGEVAGLQASQTWMRNA